MKKWLHILIVFTLLLCTTAVNAEDGKVSITLSKTTAKAGETIDAAITLENITAQNITLPLHFNSSVVKIADTNNAIVTNGIKTAAQVRDGSAGVTPMQAISGNSTYWNGAIFADSANIYYPNLDNTNGFYRLLFTNTQTKNITNETLITLKFIAIAEGNADIRFAISTDTNHDPQSPNGVSYSYQTSENDANQTAYPTATTQNLTITKADTPVIIPQQPSGGNGGGGGGFTPTTPVNPPSDGSDTLTFEVTEQLIDDNLARAADETGNSMNISINASGNVKNFIIRIPVPLIRKQVESLVLQMIFEMPIGLIGIENYPTLQYASDNSQWVTLYLNSNLNCKIDMDSTEIQGLILGFNSDNMGSVAFFQNMPILKSKFAEPHLIFKANQNGSYELVTNPLQFEDVLVTDWHYGYIQSLVTKEIINGISQTSFDPDANITREQFAKMIVLAFDIYDDTASCDFPDMQEGHWAYKYVASAANAGIITGYDTGDFGTGRNITRQEIAAMAARTGLQFPRLSQPADFTDQTEIGQWAIASVQTMQTANIINGFEDGSFKPNDNATRAQAAKIIFMCLGVF